MVSVVAMLISSVGCGQLKTTDLSLYSTTVTDFAVRLLQNTYEEDENVLISPISVLSEISEVTNDMDADALAQMEESLGMTSEELNKYIYLYTDYLSRISNRKTKVYMEESETIQANSLVFEGVWDQGFDESENEMYDRVDYSLEGAFINGFVKYFEKERYALAVLLPNENRDTSAYINSLTGEKLHGILSAPVEKEADISIPKLSFSYEVDLKDVFTDMGVTGILAEKTEDLSDAGKPVAEKNIKFDNFFCISGIDMTANGINTEREARPSPPTLTYEPPNSVYVDRPFIIIIMDCKYNIPLLIGTIVDV